MLSCDWEPEKFSKIQGLHDGSTRFAWTVISISALSGFLRTVNLQRGISAHASFIVYVANKLGNSANNNKKVKV